MGDLNNDQVLDSATYIIRYSHIKSFINCYFVRLTLRDYKFTTSFKKKSKVPESISKGKLNIDDYAYGEIVNKRKGVVF